MWPNPALAGLLVDQALAGALDPAAASLLWTADGREVLWASPAAAVIAAMVPVPARQRLALLAGGLAPQTGIRLERLRIGSALGGEPVTFACQRVALAAGGQGLLTTAVGALPPRLRPAQEGPAPARDGTFAPLITLVPPTAPLVDPVAAVRELGRAKATMRFVWQSGADGLFTSVSPNFAQVVGERSAALVGRRWQDLGQGLADAVLDGHEAVGQAFASYRTWSGLPVLWRIASSRWAVPVELSGVPVLDDRRSFAGFRGFGICRLRDLKEMPSERAAVVAPPRRQAEQPAEAPRVQAPEERRGLGQSAEAVATPPRAPESQVSRVVPFPQAPNGPGRNGAGRPRALPPAEQERGTKPDSAGEPAGAAASRGDVPRDARGDTRGDAQAPKPPVKPTLSLVERHAFREIARALGARFAGDEDQTPQEQDGQEEHRPAERLHPKVPGDRADASAPPAGDGPERAGRDVFAARFSGAPESGRPCRQIDADETALLDRLPVGILVSRGERLLHANEALLDLVGYRNLADLAAAGFTRLFPDCAPDDLEALPAGAEGARATMVTAAGRSIAVEVETSRVDWRGTPASLMTVRRFVAPVAEERARSLEEKLRSSELRESELTSILDTATDGVIVFDERGRILTLNRSAEALFGYEQSEVVGESFAHLLAPESHALAFDYLDGLRTSGVASILNDGREVIGRVRQGGRCPLFMTIGRIGDAAGRKFCAVVRDLTAWKKAELDLLEAKRAAERASAQKSDFLAKISHEVRTPLNAMIGFAEVMLEERFGPIGNERYKEYIRDIHASGGHVISLVNDLLDLAKIEAGRLDLVFAGVHLNDIVSHCVGLMQPQASRDRIVLRTALTPKLPPIVADERSMRQVVLNVLSNALKFTDAGGQVIISTTLTDRGEVMLRVRDTGIGMSDGEIEAALEPFRQLATTRRSGGTGLGLPLTKALTEANRGSLVIKSVKHEGTLVEILMPATRVLAQ